MTGAGSSRVAFRAEASQFESDDTATWYQPGKNIQVENLSIDNQSTRKRDPDDVTPQGSREGTFVGQASLSWDLTDDNWHALLPLSSGSLSGPGDLAPTAEWFFETTALDDTDAQFTESLTTSGAAIQQATLSYTEGQDVRVSVQIIFGALSDAAPAAGAITQPTVDDVFTHHGTTITVGGRSQTAAQSATLTLSNLARRQEQQERTPLRMLVGAIEPEFSTDAVFSEPDQLQAALGGSTTSIGDLIDGEASGSFGLENGLGDTISYSLTDLDPVNYSWSNLIGDTDLTEPITYHLADVGV